VVLDTGVITGANALMSSVPATNWRFVIDLVVFSTNASLTGIRANGIMWYGDTVKSRTYDMPSTTTYFGVPLLDIDMRQYLAPTITMTLQYHTIDYNGPDIAGPVGAAGAQGVTGAQGVQGPEGQEIPA
jgi:hypothetical protein